MAQGVDAVVVRTPFEEFVVRIQRSGPRPAGEGLESARWAAKQFRLGIDMGDPGVVRAARKLVRLLGGAGRFGSVLSSRRDPDSPLGSASGGVVGRLEKELLAGRLVVERRVSASLSERRDPLELDLPPLPPAARESGTHTFEVRFLDEVGKSISGIDAEITADDVQTRPTNAAGIALLEDVLASSAIVAVPEPEALSKVLGPRWETLRPGKPPRESNTTEVVFRGGELGPFPLKAELPNTIVVKPPLGKLDLELFDKAGRIRHAEREFSITGPQSFSGKTDEEGRLVLVDVFPGDYRLSLTLEFFAGDPDANTQVVEAPLVVLEQSDGAPQRRLLGAAPRSILARLHLFFNTNKSFLLPTALPAVKKLRQIYAENAPAKLLVVGHADTRGEESFNDRLSLERAESVIAYLKDDVDAWLANYDLSDAQRRWGKVEDRLMILSMPDFVNKPKGEDAVRFFQRTRGLTVDGIAGPQTRRQLVTEYQSLDGASLSDFVGEIAATAHGCGEHFPLADDQESLDAAPQDEKRDPGDRRVELFFFDTEFGITPPPPSANSKAASPEYPKWRERVAAIIDLTPEDSAGLKVHFVELADAHFRTNSAVVLPEGEAPDAEGEHAALTSVGLIASALEFNADNTGRSLLVAGHTDTTADVAFNQKLSEERAKVALALLKGGSDSRDSFATLCNARKTGADINQILSWVTRVIPNFSCDPGAISDTPNAKAVLAFQNDYNKNQASLNPSVPALNPDGVVGELTWGAFFDCYEFALKTELGVDDAGLTALRDNLKFADPERESLGFSEHFPIEELGVDSFRSQTNRRVEILFFESGEEPDTAHAADDPETSDLYLPGRYQHLPLDRSGNSQFFARVIEHESGRPLSGLKFSLVGAGTTLELVSDEQGVLKAAGVPANGPVTLTTLPAADALSENSFVVAVVGEGTPPDFLPDPLTVTELDSALELFQHRVADGETLDAIATSEGSSKDAIVAFHMGEAGASAEQSYLHFVAGARHVDDAGTSVFQDDDQPGIVQVPRPLALELELGKEHLIRFSRVVVPFVTPQPPVYMRVLRESVPTFDSPELAVAAQGLSRGELVRILEEIATEDNCKLRFVRVPTGDDETQIFFRDIPLSAPEEWFQLAADDLQTAAYASIEGEDEELNGECIYVAVDVFDEENIGV